MKQLTLAMLMYVQDYDEVYTPGGKANNDGGTNCSGNPDGTDELGNNNGMCQFSNVPYQNCWGWQCIGPDGSGSWGAHIYPYIKNYAVYVCPSANNSATNSSDSSLWVPSTSQGITDNTRQKGLSYAMIGDFGQESDAAVQQPASSAILIETGRIRAGFDADYGQDPVYYRTSRWADWYNPHNGGSDVGFSDGHVKYYKLDATGPGGSATSTGLTTWGLPYGNMCSAQAPGMFWWRHVSANGPQGDYNGDPCPGSPDN
jgi:prepilin-type processing-associated H-X9-DG protein